MLSMPASPSPIPSYAMASMGAPQYTMTTSPTPLGAAAVSLPATFHQPYGTGANFGGVDGLGPYGSVQGGRGQFEGAMSHDTAPPPPGQGPGLGPQTPRFYKLDFPTYDGTVDPLNWINQCEQFFRGQRTSASDRTWLASYHLTGATQTWYYALEQDEGMPAWGRFCELCTLHFGPAVRGTKLSELARLPFISTVHDYAERFNAVLCHAHNHVETTTRSSLWEDCPTTYGSTSSYANPRTCKQPCTWHGHSNAVRLAQGRFLPYVAGGARRDHRRPVHPDNRKGYLRRARRHQRVPLHRHDSSAG
jgi:hypothetical protein